MKLTPLFKRRPKPKRRAYERIKDGLEEALAIARGEKEPASVYPPEPKEAGHER